MPPTLIQAKLLRADPAPRRAPVLALRRAPRGLAAHVLARALADALRSLLRQGGAAVSLFEADGDRLTPHAHHFVLWQTFHRAPTGPDPAHTVFMVLVCTDVHCRAFQLFPPENFALTTPEFQAQFRETAEACGLRREDRT